MAGTPVHTLSGHSRETLEQMQKVLDTLPMDEVHEPEPLDELLAHMREFAAERYAAHAGDPDYDLPPMFDFTGRRGSVPLMAPFDSDEEKEFVFTQIAPRIMEGVSATRWVLAHPVWGAYYGEGGGPGPDEEGYVSPRDRPDRVEMVHVHGCDLDRYVSWMAAVDRTERGVRIGVWDKKYDLHWSDASGLVIDPMNEQLVRQRLAETARRMVFNNDVPEGFWTEERAAALKELADLLESIPDDDPAAARAGLREVAEKAGPDRLFEALGVFERKDGNLWPSRMLLEHAGLPELVRA